MKTIMLIDDEPTVIQGLSEEIDWPSLGITEVIEAYNGEEAYQIMEKQRIDIIVSDIRMPLLDGLSLAKIVKEKLPLCRLIILSGYDLFSYAQEAMKYNVFRFLSKPCPYSEIRESVQEAIIDQDRQIQRIELIQNAEQKLELLLPMIQRNLLKNYIINDEEINPKQWEILKTIISYLNEEIFMFQVYISCKYSNLPDLQWIMSNVLKKYEEEYHMLYLNLPVDNTSMLVALFPNKLLADDVLKSLEKICDLLFPGNENDNSEISIFSPIHAFKESGDFYIRIMEKAALPRSGTSEKIILSGAWERKSVLAHKMVIKAKKYIETHLNENYSIQDIADHLQIHPDYLSHLFRDSDNVNLQSYIIQRRIEFAAQMLKDPSARIYDIAYKVGYSSPYHFSRMFKKIKGISPKNYQIHNS